MAHDTQLIDPVAAASPDAAQDSAEAAALALARHVLAGGTWGDAHGTTAKEYDALYALAHGLYGQGRYAEALDVFSLLYTYNHFERRHVMGLAACLQMLGRHEQALLYYSLASFMDLTDPMATFHSCECLLALGRADEALDGLVSVGKQCDDQRHRGLRAKAEGLAALIHQQRAHSSAGGCAS